MHARGGPTHRHDVSDQVMFSWSGTNLPDTRIHRPDSTSMVSASLADRLLPDSQKHAIVSPLPKKTLDVAYMANYRPVSNLTFVSKVIERAVASQLNEYLVANYLLPRYQSAYRKKHSTETAMLRVSTWKMIAASCPTALGALCGQLTFQLAWSYEHSVVTATELLQPLDLACGTLFRPRRAIQTSPTNCSDDSWRDIYFGKHEHGALWLLICGALEKYSLTYIHTSQTDRHTYIHTDRQPSKL